jgi:magnesium chelatase subunit D
VPIRIEDDRLLGGLDLTASLAAGRAIAQRGILAEANQGVVFLAMAERIDNATAARLAAVLDQGEVVIERDGLAMRLPAEIGVIALDEGLSPEERPPQALLERLAFRLDPNALEHFANDESYDSRQIECARVRLAAVDPPGDDIIEALCVVARTLGVDSPRAAILALRAARAHAALRGRAQILTEDIAIAARLVLAPQAHSAPDEASLPPSEDPSEDGDGPGDAAAAAEAQASSRDTPAGDASDLMVAAIQAVLPNDLLARLSAADGERARAARTSGAGAVTMSARRGRPTGSRQGALRSGDRLNLPETLRAATPWQKLRHRGSQTARLQIRQEDFRIRRFARRRESTTIFVVDVSGSAAAQRLAEAKGAVELLLAKAYVARARVALVAFRGSGAELLLPPTRSLTLAKRRLADLPGGGGTPLAAGLDTALMVALAERAKDRTPLIVLLTDGRANVARNGSPGRGEAETDALAASANVREAGIGAAFIDTSARPRPDADHFARAMGAVYAPLPFVNANAVFEVVGELQSTRR